MVFGARTSSEQEVYTALSRQLPSPPYEVLPSTEFLGEGPSGEVIEGEFDILIFHLEDGILVIEVKGGGINYDGRSRTWHSIDHEHLRHSIDDPFKQASKAARYIRKRLREIGIGAGTLAAIPVGHAVFFPDIEWGKKRIPAHGRRDLVFDCTHLSALRQSVKKVMGLFRKRHHKGLTHRGIVAVKNEILYPMADAMPTLRSMIKKEEAKFVRMTEQQRVVLDLLSETKRVAIRGYAGTGKTLLAIEKARRLSHDGLQVALLCFNKPLADHMRRTLIEYSDRVHVTTYHALCRGLCLEAGLEFNVPGGSDEQNWRFWDEQTPVMMMDAIEKTGKHYDGVIVDEGQDFRADWLEALDALLGPEGDGYFYLFMDPKQKIYCDEDRLPVPVGTLVLKTNCRNTKKIGQLVCEFGRVEMLYSPDTPRGARPRYVKYKSQKDQVSKMEATVYTLIHKQRLEPEDVVCLSTHSRPNSCLAEVDELAGVPITADLLLPENQIRFSSLHRFKGLEAKVILLCDVSRESDSCEPEHLYVATSRARHRIFIFHDKTWSPPSLA